MSKKIILFICGLLLMMSQAAPAADTLRIWNGAVTGEGFTEFRARLGQIGGVYPDGSLSAEKLALGACSMAVQQKKLSDLGQCQTDFRRLNGLPAVSKFGDGADKVSMQSFLDTARGTKGWQLPQVASAPSVQAAPVTNAPSGATLEELQAARAAAAAAAASNRKLAGEVATLQGKVNRLPNPAAAAQRAVDAKLLPLANDLSGRIDHNKQAVTTLSKEFGAEQVKANGLWERYEQHQTTVNMLVGIALAGLIALAVYVFVGPRKAVKAQKETLVEVHHKLMTAVDTGVAKRKELDSRLGALEAQVADVAVTAEKAAKTAHNAAKVAVGAVELAAETKELVLSSADISFDDTNLGIKTSDELPIGEKSALVWCGTCRGKRFVIKLWREETTPDGCVQTDIIRSTGSRLRSEPISFKRLEQRIVAAVVAGRVKFVEAASVVA